MIFFEKKLDRSYTKTAKLQHIVPASKPKYTSCGYLRLKVCILFDKESTEGIGKDDAAEKTV
jgi:hypothetical protein